MKSKMLHRRVFFFIDNDAARAGLIKMTSDVPVIRRVQLDLVKEWASTPSFPWFARVPSSSNIADSVSRLEKLPFRHEGAVEVFPDLNTVLFEVAEGEAEASMKRTTAANRKRKHSWT